MSYKTTNVNEAMKLQAEGRPLIGYTPPGKETESWEFADEKKVSPKEIAREEFAKAQTNAEVAEANAKAARAKAKKATADAETAEEEADNLEENAENLRDISDKAKKKMGKPEGYQEEGAGKPATKKKKKRKNQ